MKQHILKTLSLFTALMTALLCAAGVLPFPAAADAQNGYWKLVKTAEYGTESRQHEKISYSASASQGNLSVYFSDDSNWVDVTASAESPKQRYKGNEEISIAGTVHLSGSANAFDDAAEGEGFGFFVWYALEEVVPHQYDSTLWSSTGIICSDGSVSSSFECTSLENTNEGSVLIFVDTVHKSNSGTLEGALPFGKFAGDKLSVVYGTRMCGDYFMQDFCGTIFTYEWVPDEAETVLNVSGFVMDAAYQNMPGLPVCVMVGEVGGQYVESYENRVTDKNGNFNVSLTVPADIKQPIVYLEVKLKHMTPDGDTCYTAIDDSDPTSVNDGYISISGFMPLSEKQSKEMKSTGRLDIPLCACFSLLANDLPLFLLNSYAADSRSGDYTTNLSDIITVEGIELTAAERLLDASITYTNLSKCYDYAADTLGEADALNTGSPLKVLLRSREVIKKKEEAYYTILEDGTEEIRLCPELCRRTDDAVFTIMHEFGHFLDHRTAAGEYHLCRYALGDENHGGIWNSTMDDSYTEGFATYFAAMIRRANNYSNPERMTRSVLDIRERNFAYLCEEAAISTYLYQASWMLGDDKKIWDILRSSRSSFREYFNELLGAGDGNYRAVLERLAVKLGLFTCPYEGNGKYDPWEPRKHEIYEDTNQNGRYDAGEPYIDANKNGQWDADSRYLDLIFDFGRYGTQDEPYYAPADPEKWKAYKESLVLGIAADYDRRDTRNVPKMLKSCCLSVEAEEGVQVPYVKVTVVPEEGTAYSSLCSTENWVPLFSPELDKKGTVTAEIPGGSVIFTGDMEAIAQTAAERGSNQPAALAYVTAGQLAPEPVTAVPTYGDPEAPGYVKKNAVTLESLGLVGNTGGTVDPEPGDYHTDKLIMVFLGIAAFVVVLLLVVVIRCAKRKKRTAAQIIPERIPAPLYPQDTAGGTVCASCGQPVRAGCGFCTVCGTPVRQAQPEQAQPHMKHCTHCGMAVEENVKFCYHCGNPFPPA